MTDNCCELAIGDCGMATDVVAAFVLDSSLLPSTRASVSFGPGGLSFFTVLCPGCLLAFLLLPKKTQSAMARRRKRRMPTATPTTAVVGSAVGELVAGESVVVVGSDVVGSNVAARKN